MATPPELEAFIAESEALEAVLGGVPTEVVDWHALGSWTVADLVGHLIGVAGRLTRLSLRAKPHEVDLS